jgi:predicted HAD superfamily phosphohydrolase
MSGSKKRERSPEEKSDAQLLIEALDRICEHLPGDPVDNCSDIDDVGKAIRVELVDELVELNRHASTIAEVLGELKDIMVRIADKYEEDK